MLGWVKAHPFLTAAAALGVYALVKRSSASATTAPAPAAPPAGSGATPAPQAAAPYAAGYGWQD